MTEEDELAFIKSSISSGSFSVVAVEDGRILGSCDIRIATKARIRHRAEMGIAVRKGYWGLGISQKLLEKALQEAESRGVKKIELQVRKDNERAKAFCKRNGFVCTGPDSMLFCINGEFIDGERYQLILP